MGDYYSGYYCTENGKRNVVINETHLAQIASSRGLFCLLSNFEVTYKKRVKVKGGYSIMENSKHLIFAVIGYILINMLVNGEPRGWAGVIGAAIGGGLSAFLFDKD